MCRIPFRPRLPNPPQAGTQGVQLTGIDLESWHPGSGWSKDLRKR
ncbi:hypothetical protein LI90_62 [Carbonactinospora thermoautotrophica]|uniref:Uncharacterized protein n=1 Tax=Carbonactinospora thermoautotrophica TaxID=1469144 RepID=A0A132MKP7_9ACTN|nr:hypothetical protein LI90_62 [Carbonactinospora thermoautotrophica]